MKKLLILMLVLGLTSVSYGSYGDIRDDFKLCLSGTTLTVVGLSVGPVPSAGVFDETVVIQTYSAPLVALGDGGVGTYAAGALWAIALASGPGYDGFQFTAMDSSPATDAVDVMDWFTLQYNGSVGDIMNIYDNTVSTVVPVGTLTIVPEPMTIALLGLGSLFLLRRRK